MFVHILGKEHVVSPLQMEELWEREAKRCLKYQSESEAETERESRFDYLLLSFYLLDHTLALKFLIPL